MNKIVFIGGEDVSARIPLAKNFINRGYKVEIIGSEDFNNFKNLVIKYRRIDLNREFSILDDIRTCFQIREILKSMPDNIIAHSFDTKLSVLVPFAAVGLKNIKVVRTINGMGRIFSGIDFKNLVLRFFYIFTQLVIKSFVDYTVFQNRENFSYFKSFNLLNIERSAVIRGSGIDLKKFYPDVDYKELIRLRSDLNLDNGYPVFIFISRLVRQKGVKEYLEAASMCFEQGVKCNFLLVGQLDSNSDAMLIQEIQQHSNYVQYLGRRTDVKALLSISDVFVLPTYYSEGLPRVLLEASAMSLALLSTNQPGCNDILVDNFNGLFVEQKNVLDLFKKMKNVVADEDRLNRFKMNSKIHVSNFSLVNVVDQYHQVYTKLWQG